jgi:hypothetical protein
MRPKYRTFLEGWSHSRAVGARTDGLPVEKMKHGCRPTGCLSQTFITWRSSSNRSSRIAAQRGFLHSRTDTALVVLGAATVARRKSPRPKLDGLEKLFWTTFDAAARAGDVLVLVQTRDGRPMASALPAMWRSAKITEEIRGLIRHLAEGNPAWGAQDPGRGANEAKWLPGTGSVKVVKSTTA